MPEDVVQLGHGSGGKLSHHFIDNTILNHFTSPLLQKLPDSARFQLDSTSLAFTTDSYVVDPLIFPGGDIGKLAVCGTVNDLSVVGAIPKFISCALIIEEGLPTSELDAILASLASEADKCNVEVVTGDTKVVPKGKVDKLFINTAGIGTVPETTQKPDADMHLGDAILVTGPIGDHGAAVMAQRKGLKLETNVESDCAPLTSTAQAILSTAQRTSFLRDVTRGGLATILNEAVSTKPFGMELIEDDIPIRPPVRSLCELLGIDPLYLACEGQLVAIVDDSSAPQVIQQLSALPCANDAQVVGTVTEDYAGQLVGRTLFGTHRLIQMLSGEQLPRIC